MKVLIDTCIWSYALRNNKNKTPKNEHLVKELSELIKESRVEIMDAIRQEILSGIKQTSQFDTLSHSLSFFSDIVATQEEYVLAAELFNKLRSKGIQGSNTDYLICAVAINHGLSIFTDDRDFLSFRKHIDIHLHQVRIT